MNLLSYVDDSIVFTMGVDVHVGVLVRVLEVFWRAGLKLKAKKCDLFKDSVTFLGHQITQEGITPVDDKLEVIKKMAPPKTAKDLRLALGFFSYYRLFIPNFASLTAELSAMTSQHRFNWLDRHTFLFNQLKEAFLKCKPRK